MRPPAILEVTCTEADHRLVAQRALIRWRILGLFSQFQPDRKTSWLLGKEPFTFGSDYETDEYEMGLHLCMDFDQP
jgi:hypothetical protein